MFFSSFSYFFICHFVQTHIFATKVLLFLHIRKREINFFDKKSYFLSCSSPISLHLGEYHRPLHSTPYTLHLTPEKSLSKVNFLAHIKKKYYFCDRKAIFPSQNDVNNRLKQLWNTNLVLAVVLCLFVSTRIPPSANVQAWGSLLLFVRIWQRNTPTNASAASALSN